MSLRTRAPPLDRVAKPPDPRSKTRPQAAGPGAGRRVPPRAEREAEAAENRRLRILATVDDIPRGRVSTYGRIAAEAGLGRAARLVGRTLRDLDVAVPWHRVLNAAGKSSLTGDGAAEQRRRLEAEGVEFRPSGSVDLKRFGWP